MSDYGLTHIALECTDLDRSIIFYERYGGFKVVHRRDSVAWISDRTRPFAIVLAEVGVGEDVHPVAPFPHLGFACGDRATFDRLIEQARDDGCLRAGPHEGTGPAGTWAFLDDPDGNTLEISLGQSVEDAVAADDKTSGPLHRPIIGVMGSGTDANEAIAEPLGEAIARGGFHLLTGGGGGTMTAVARGFTAADPRAGVSIGVLPGDATGATPAGYPNEFIELPIRTHLNQMSEHGDAPMSRNHINVLTPDAIVALPGGPGTRSEIELAVRYHTPIIVHDSWASSWPDLPRWTTIQLVSEWLATYDRS